MAVSVKQSNCGNGLERRTRASATTRRAMRLGSGWRKAKTMRRDCLAVQSAIEDRLEQLSMENISVVMTGRRVTKCSRTRQAFFGGGERRFAGRQHAHTPQTHDWCGIGLRAPFASILVTSENTPPKYARHRTMHVPFCDVLNKCRRHSHPAAAPA